MSYEKQLTAAWNKMFKGKKPHEVKIRVGEAIWSYYQAKVIETAGVPYKGPITGTMCLDASLQPEEFVME